MRRFAISVLLVALIAAACGGGDSPEAATDLNITMSDFAFDPDKVAVPPGAEITITLDNVGSVEHEWVILKDGVQIERESELPEDEETLLADFVYWEAEVEAGESDTFTFTAPERGFFQVICAIPGHFTAGMEGRLQAVRPDEGE
jgi:uncharacterized cupredoxin-like copper-binding protein